jgi:hypothetical protein
LSRVAETHPDSRGDNQSVPDVLIHSLWGFCSAFSGNPGQIRPPHSES